MKRIGITGSLASGKSTVSEFFQAKGHLVISADEINKQLLKEEKHILHINELLFARVSEVLDKKKIAQLIFADKEKKKALEEYLHPLIYLEMKKILNASNEEVVFLEIPLLYETNFRELVDYVIVVSVDEKTQIKRIMKRDKLTVEEAYKRIKGQMPLKEKVSKADYVIDNSKNIKKTHQQLDVWYKKYIRR